MSQQTAPTGELRIVALTDIHVEDGFNPRDSFERSELKRLTSSIATHGLLQPLVVAPNKDGYRLIAGERRYRAACAAGLEQVPAIVRDTGENSGLDLAVLENVMRQDLDLVAEARAYRRLIDEQRLTRKGVADHLGVSQKRITERLQILELPGELQPKVAKGEIPPGAIKALARLAKVHPGLPQLAVGRVTAPPMNQWDEPVSWSQLAADPIAVVVGQYEHQRADLPADVYEGGMSYPLGRFSLSEKAQQDAAKLRKLLEVDPDRLTVRFDREEIEQAEALKAAHRSNEGHSVLIVGQDVADQLAGDYVGRQLKQARAQERCRRERERKDAENATGTGADAASETDRLEEGLREQRRREREAEQEARLLAAAHNAELGIAVVKAFAKVKLDERAVKVLATLDVGGDLDQLAMRGARYGFPGWVEQTQTNGGKPTTGYIERRSDAGDKAREYLSVAKAGSEVAGRLLALVAMARYAEEGAVAQSAQSSYHLPVPSGLPWSGEIVDLIDDLAAERLPDHLTAKKRAERIEQREQEAEREALRQSIADRVARGGELDGEERSQLREEIIRAYGRWSPQAHDLNEQLDELDLAASPAGDGETDAADDQPAESEPR